MSLQKEIYILFLNKSRFTDGARKTCFFSTVLVTAYKLISYNIYIVLVEQQNHIKFISCNVLFQIYQVKLYRLLKKNFKRFNRNLVNLSLYVHYIRNLCLLVL